MRQLSLFSLLTVLLFFSSLMLESPFAAPKTAKKATPSPVVQESEAVTAAKAYQRGEYAKAREIWQKMAEKGDALAMNNLGILYDRGLGGPTDLGRAVHYFALSAKAGSPQGMSNYGWMLDQGRGIASDPAEAARWYDKAARLGQAEAQYNLGLMYERGRGVPQSMSSAAAWYGQAAAQQQTEALARLGHLYREGTGVSKDLSRAALLLYAAAMNGSADAIKELQELAPKDASSKGIALFGQRMDHTNRRAMRAALKKSGVQVVREKDNFICDLYDVHSQVPGASQMTVCYGTQNQALGFLKIDYAAPTQEYARQVQKMVEGRFGAVTAKESDESSMWNMGSIVIATQYARDKKQMSLMYMVPRVYHQTRVHK